MVKSGDDRILVLIMFSLIAFGAGMLVLNRSEPMPKATVPAKIEKVSTVPPRAETDFGPFMAQMQRRIKRNWFPPKNAESLQGKVLFKVSRDGSLANLRMAKSTGLASADKAMLDAVQNSANFNPLPAGAPESVDIEFSFDYNVFNGGDRHAIPASSMNR